MIIVSLTGHSNSGKTSLAKELTRLLSKEGIPVTYIKNIPHDDASFDAEGKDTENLLSAGAVVSAGRSPSKTFFTFNGSMQISEIIMMIRERSRICIFEGFRNELDQLSPQIRVIMDLGSAAVIFHEEGGKPKKQSFLLWSQFGDLVNQVSETLHKML